MAIRVTHGRIADVAKLGVLAGQSVAAQREIEYARTMQQRLIQMEHEKEMTQFRAQLDLQASMRSQQWELEKMEIRSRTDFAREESGRQQKLAEKQSRLDALERAFKEGQISEEDYQNAHLQESTDVPFYTYAKQAERAAATTAARQDPVKQYIAQMLAEEQPGAAPTAPATTGRIRVVSPQGQSGTIEAAEWPTYQAQGFRLLSSTKPESPEKPPSKAGGAYWRPELHW